MNTRQKRYQRHRQEEIDYVKDYRKRCPWIRFYTNAKQRCENPKATPYYKYGAKGIKFLMTSQEMKKLWFRDKAYNLSRPSIDRKNSSKNYTYANCQFIELRINCCKRRY